MYGVLVAKNSNLPDHENINNKEVIKALYGNYEEFLAYHVLMQIHETGGFRFVGQMELLYQENIITEEVIALGGNPE